MKCYKTFLLITILFVFASGVFAQEKSYEIITHEDVLFGKNLIYEKTMYGKTYDAGYVKIFGLDGKLWLGGKGGVYRLDGDTWTTIKLDEEFSDEVIEPRAVSHDGVLWFTTYPGSKTYRFDGETCTSTTLGHEGITIKPSKIVIGPDGVVWTCGRGVVFYYKDDMWTKTVVDFALGSAIVVQKLAVDPDGVVYAATNGGVYMYKDGKWINTYGPEGMDKFDPFAHDAMNVAIGPDGKVWVVTSFGEISWYDGETWTKTVEFTEIQSKVTDMCKDLMNIILREIDYFSSQGEYIHFEFGEDCEPVQWESRYNENFEVSFQDSTAIAREKVDINGDGDTDDGLMLSVAEIKEVGWKIKEKRIIPGSNVTWDTRFGEGPSGYWHSRMAFSLNGELWITSSSNFDETILFQYDGETWIQYTPDDGLTEESNSSIYIAPDGVIWVIASKSVSQLIPIPTNVETDENIPSEFTITGNYPNPFNPTTTIEFIIPELGFVQLTIYNITGQKIRELAADTMPAGTHSVVWNGRDENGMMVSSGIYLSRLKSGKHVTAGRMLLMK